MKRRNNNIKIATFNVRGMNEKDKKQRLRDDMKRYNVDICCLQETKIGKSVDKQVGEYRFINIKPKCIYYGNGYVIAPKWKNNIVKYWKVSDRISVLQLRLKDDEEKYTSQIVNGNNTIKMKIIKKEKRNLLSVINVYAPTAERAKENPEELNEFYMNLNDTLIDIKKLSSLILIGGDFNAKVGKRSNGEACLGRYSRGIRNDSGERLIDFCNMNNLFISNSGFKNPARHMTTWHCKRLQNGVTVNIYNQIDYIICPMDRKHILKNARSYSGTLVDSDHRIVITELEIDFVKMYKPHKNSIGRQFNSYQLNSNDDKRNEYYESLQTKLQSTDEEVTWDNIKEKITKTAEEVIGYKNMEKNKRPENNEVEQLSKRQKELRLKISECDDAERRIEMKTERNKKLHQIKQILINDKEKQLDQKVKEINEAKDATKMFKCVRELSRKKNENPFVHDEQGRNVTNPQDIYKIVNEHFQKQFFDETEEKIEPFEGNARKLNNEIKLEEVKRNIKKLKNNKAPGHDKITSEMIKYGPDILYEKITEVLNKNFEEHKEIDTGKGILAPINKVNKTKGPKENLRAVTLLPIIRKILSNTTLERIQSKTEEYLSKSQSAYREFRSTSDIVWTHRWLVSRIEMYKEKLFITGIDMSSAFDTIKRGRLIEIIRTFLEDDDVRMIRYLLSNTTLEVKINGAKSKSFISNIGSPQGDGLSGKLYTIYFENAIKEVRIMLDETEKLPQMLPEETIYADDVDFIAHEVKRKENLQSKVKTILLKENLKVNETKTEETILERKNKGDHYICDNLSETKLIIKKNETEEWRKTKKLGSLLGVTEDINRRKQLATAALIKMNTIWIRKDKIKQTLRVKLYKAIVKPILLYNSGTWSPTRKEENDLDAFHRCQLRKILNVKYPVIMRNSVVYRETGEEFISLEIIINRWKLFGHTLRLDKDTPAQKAMGYYFTESTTGKYRGRPRVNLPQKLNEDLERYGNGMKLKTVEDLKTLKDIAEDRKAWKYLVERIYVAAKAEKNLLNN